jgi:hypothetical protein
MTNPLERQLIQCPDFRKGELCNCIRWPDDCEYINSEEFCGDQHLVKEPAEQRAERCAKIADKLATLVVWFTIGERIGPNFEAQKAEWLDKIAKEVADET